jgi:hypothetical protein
VIPRRRLRAAGALLSILMVSCALSGNRGVGDAGGEVDDPVGAWMLKCVSPDGKRRECVVTVFKEGAILKGLYTADGETRPAKNVAFDEGLLSVEVDGKFAGQNYGLTYKGVPRGDALQGTVRFSFGWASGSFAFEGERIEQQVASAP